MRTDRSPPEPLARGVRGLLILGGTTEGYALAEALSERSDLRVVSSLAGRTEQPRRPCGESRIGGFGGIPGLIDYLRAQRLDAVIDATHPFAATMGWNAAAACDALGLPLLRLERPAWQPQPGDDWQQIDDWPAAVAALQRSGARRVLLAVGRQELAPFAALDAVSFLIRAVSAPRPLPAFKDARVLLARGPFTLVDERALLADERIDTIVCKNSGGAATAAKLRAARELGVRVIMRQRAPRPPTTLATDVQAALAWLDTNVSKPSD
ncbi:MAG: cobalt-precorrin-6A reductase [Halochromatium sp.]|uniref:cobalt-precorrin-6A reductase n=1 Tax=Halochromatium sp. TaxID=2049430 RepID=UPI00397BB3EF